MAIVFILLEGGTSELHPALSYPVRTAGKQYPARAVGILFQSSTTNIVLVSGRWMFEDILRHGKVLVRILLGYDELLHIKKVPAK